VIDFSAIEDELVDVITAAATFTSTQTGYIREVIPITQMPSLDVSAQGHSTQHNANRTYTVPIICVIRRKGVDRAANATAFKVLVEQICAALEAYTHPANFDAARNFTSNIGMEQSGDGAIVRTVVITFNVLAH